MGDGHRWILLSVDWFSLSTRLRLGNDKIIKLLHISIVDLPVPRPTYELLMSLSMRDFPTK